MPPSSPGPMTLGNMRSLGVRSLAVTCELYNLGAVLPVDPWSDAVPVRAFAPRMVCTACGIVGADARGQKVVAALVLHSMAAEIDDSDRSAVVGQSRHSLAEVADRLRAACAVGIILHLNVEAVLAPPVGDGLGALLNIALFQLFEAEVCPEEACGAVLKCNPPVAGQRTVPGIADSDISAVWRLAAGVVAERKSRGLPVARHLGGRHAQTHGQSR